MLTPGHIILSIPISFDWIVVCAAVQTSTQPPYITHQGCASHQHWLLFNSIFNHLILLQHHTLADRCYSTVLQYLQQLLSLSWVIIKADHYFLSDYTALIHCSLSRNDGLLLCVHPILCMDSSSSVCITQVGNCLEMVRSGIKSILPLQGSPYQCSSLSLCHSWTTLQSLLWCMWYWNSLHLTTGPTHIH